MMLAGPITLGGGVTLATTAGGATAGANLTLTGAVDAAVAGAESLTLDAGIAGTIALSGSIGSGTALGAVTITDHVLNLAADVGIATDDAAFSQTGATILQGGMTAGATTITTSGGNLALGAVDATSPGAQSLALAAGAGTITLSGAIGGATALGAITLSDGSLHIGAGVGSIKSDAAFSQTGATLLQGAATTVAVANANIGFSGTIDGTSSGAEALTLQAGTGTITLTGNVGSSTPLGAVTVTGGGAVLDGSLSGGAISVAGSTGVLLGAAVTSTGGQIYNGVVTLDAATSLTDTGGNAITFDSTIDGAETLHVSTSGTIALAQTIGATTPLGAVTLAGGAVDIDAAISGGADQRFRHERHRLLDVRRRRGGNLDRRPDLYRRGHARSRDVAHRHGRRRHHLPERDRRREGAEREHRRHNHAFGQ